MKLRGQTACTKGASALPLFLMFSLALSSPSGVLAQLPVDLVIGITSPTSGALVRGTITVRANITLPVVAGVQFKLDGANLGAEDTTAPYEVPWNTTTASSGSHTLRAVARDLLGLLHTSDPVTVTVDNVPPTVTINQAPARQIRPMPRPSTSRWSSASRSAASPLLTSPSRAPPGGTKTVTVTGGPSTYNVAVSGMHQRHRHRDDRGWNGASDAAGNANTASTSTDNTVTVDAIAPTVTINQAAAQARSHQHLADQLHRDLQRAGQRLHRCRRHHHGHRRAAPRR